MSLKSSLVNLSGIDPDSPFFQRGYNFYFNLRNFFDLDAERKQILRTVRDYTHVDYKRLRSLWDMVGSCYQRGLPGAFVETGVWRGGTAGIMAYVAKKYGYGRKLYFFDSFEGLPQPTEKDGRDAILWSGNLSSGFLVPIGRDVASDDYIKELLFEKLAIEQDKAVIVKGWFQDALPIYKNQISQIALLRLDGDWYESTKVSLENLFDLVVEGGFVIFDDYYCWDGCRKAVDEFIKERKLGVKVKRIDSSGAYFNKTSLVG